jgi:hypothetical protein
MLCLLGAGLAAAAQPACPGAEDYRDENYGAAIRCLVRNEGHEHNLYYTRDPWNADGSLMVGIHSDLMQRNWKVLLFDGEGCFQKELFSVEQFDWRLTWDRHKPDILYTWRASSLYEFNVQTGAARLLKSFAPSKLMPNGPSLNQTGDRILVITADGTFRSFALPEMNEERAFQMTFPEGCYPAWDKPRYIGYRNFVFASCSSGDGRVQAVLIYDDTGALHHVFEGVGGGGHHDFSPDGRWAYFKLPSGPRGGPRSPLEIHVVNIDGTDDRVLYSVPASDARYVHNLHLAWPSRVNDWFIASFFPNAANLPPSYAPPLDEILQLRLDGNHRFLARTHTAYSTAGGRTGGAQDMFWAQPLARPSAGGRRIAFNSIRSGTIDLCILTVP